jgi:hypothetical protein
MGNIHWHKDYDASENTIWEAASPLHDDGSPFYWRLIPKLEGDQVRWYEGHDAELANGVVNSFDTLDEGKAFIQEKHDRIISEYRASTEGQLEQLKAFAESLLNPEQNGRAVSAYIRDQAREALGMKKVESPKTNI